MKQLFVFFLLLSTTSFSQNDTEIKILSWNTFLRPGILLDNQSNRAKYIGEYLFKQNADVLVLQEVFHRKSRKILINELKQTYPFHTKSGLKSFFGVPSGVLIFSKNTILKERHISFKKKKNADVLAKKGGISIEIEFNNERCQIIGTHLQAGSGDKEAKIRKSQLKRLNKLNNPQIDHTIYAGDFNMENSGFEFSNMLDELDCRNDSIYDNTDYTSNFVDYSLQKSKNHPKWIDFILIKRHERIEYKKTWIEKAPKRKDRYLSDHNIIFSTLSLLPD